MKAISSVTTIKYARWLRDWRTLMSRTCWKPSTTNIWKLRNPRQNTTACLERFWHGRTKSLNLKNCPKICTPKSKSSPCYVLCFSSANSLTSTTATSSSTWSKSQNLSNWTNPRPNPIVISSPTKKASKSLSTNSSPAYKLNSLPPMSVSSCPKLRLPTFMLPKVSSSSQIGNQQIYQPKLSSLSRK